MVFLFSFKRFWITIILLESRCDNGSSKKIKFESLDNVNITVIKFFKTDKIAGILMIPYILWTVFATYLTFYIWMFNEM